jgi:AcrR family transcriptional regulator
MTRLAQPPRPLPPGRHGLPRQFVAQNQRERMLVAIVSAVSEKGYQATTVEDVVRGSGVSRKTFYEQFKNKEDCFLAAYDELVGRLVATVDQAYHAQTSWQARAVAAVGALLEFFASEPEAAQIGMIEVMAAGPVALERYRLAQRGFTVYLQETAERSSYTEDISRDAALAAIGGMAAVIAEMVREGKTRQLPAIRDEVATFGLAFFVGSAEAQRAVEVARVELDGGPEVQSAASSVSRERGTIRA